ncbi:hypothetical protein FVEG_14063 [Fusarium verticillioides 7600]|uniref:Uncharacterized protein n=1 Tax=Gibberella moniliformis (strain M3125 / FGSC 7600) TaxID=334819 RepID=W7N781_GIBM7|nr:hypothetical protein FVEG_14063 [Fusarium verticillioides 7600]EWG55955.1 hypothetical protein FVEG_14063 [Fusarium verticillioides 7600]
MAQPHKFGPGSGLISGLRAGLAIRLTAQGVYHKLTLYLDLSRPIDQSAVASSYACPARLPESETTKYTVGYTCSVRNTDDTIAPSTPIDQAFVTLKAKHTRHRYHLLRSTKYRQSVP